MTTAIFKLVKYVSCARDLGLPESERLDLLQEGNPYQQRCQGVGTTASIDELLIDRRNVVLELIKLKIDENFVSYS